MKLKRKLVSKTSKGSAGPRDPADSLDIGKRIKPVAQISGDTNVVFYGRSGSGKTTLAASFPKPLLVIDCNDKGTDSIADIEGVFVLRAASWQDIEDAYWYVAKGKKFKTVVIDTVSNIQEFAIREIKGQADIGEKQPGEWGTMTKRDWGQVSSMLKSLLLNFRDLDGVNAVFIAQDRVFHAEDEDLGTDDAQIMPEVGPRLMPSVASTINAAVNVIGNTFVRERIREYKIGKQKRTKRIVEYCLRVGPHSYYTTKLRKPKGIDAPAFIKDPTYEKLVAAIAGKEWDE